MIADKILKSGFDINYKINEKYGRIEDLPLKLKQKYMLKEAAIKEYLKSKNIQDE